MDYNVRILKLPSMMFFFNKVEAIY
jgi:hypothetical protein